MKKIKHLLFFITLLFLSFSCSNIEETSQLKSPETIGSATNYPNPNSNYDYTTPIRLGKTSGADKKKIDRTYNVHLPKNFDDSGKIKYSVIILLHGFTSTGKAIGDRMKEHAFKNNIVLVCPNGWEYSWNAGSCCEPSISAGIDDMTFLERIVSNFYKANYVNTQEINLAGFSNGGMMVYRFILHSPLAKYINAAAVVSGALRVDITPTLTSKVPLIHIHSEKDVVVPYGERTLHNSVYKNLEVYAKRFYSKYKTSTLELSKYTFYAMDDKEKTFLKHYKLKYISTKDGKPGLAGHFWPTSPGTDGKLDATYEIAKFFRPNSN